MQSLKIISIEDKDFFGTETTVRNMVVTAMVEGQVFTGLVRRSHFRNWLQSDAGWPFLFNPEAAQDDDPELFIINGGEQLDEAMLMYLIETDKLPFGYDRQNAIFSGVMTGIKLLTKTYASRN